MTHGAASNRLPAEQTKTPGLPWPSVECHTLGGHRLSVRGLASNHEHLPSLSIGCTCFFKCQWVQQYSHQIERNPAEAASLTLQRDANRPAHHGAADWHSVVRPAVCPKILYLWPRFERRDLAGLTITLSNGRVAEKTTIRAEVGGQLIHALSEAPQRPAARSLRHSHRSATRGLRNTGVRSRR